MFVFLILFLYSILFFSSSSPEVAGIRRRTTCHAHGVTVGEPVCVARSDFAVVVVGGVTNLWML